SICHFKLQRDSGEPGYLLPHADEVLHLQSMLKLAMELARRERPADLPRRKRLLLTLLDGFAIDTAVTIAADDRLAIAWRQASNNLHRMRTLADVAAMLGVSESRLRAMHRQAWNTS